MSVNDFEIVIGLEVHVQLSTQSKIFCSDSAAFDLNPNTHVSLISLAHPGTLPKLNLKVLEYGARLGLALGCSMEGVTTFERKNYFYPDLPKGYQITQYRNPLCRGGSVKIQKAGSVKEIAIHHIHLEEDAGKLMHFDGKDVSGVDYNRAGVPLLEIVTTPCMHDPEEAAAFVSEIRKLVRFIGIGDGNMEEGSLRADANVSVRAKGSGVLGTKVEIKNMNSTKNLRTAVQHEAERQIACLQRGEAIVSETRLFDVDAGKTFSMRQKEEVNDYRYFPEPDLCSFEITNEWLASIRESMPKTSDEYELKFVQQFHLPAYDAVVLASEVATARLFEELAGSTAHAKSAANWVLGPVKNYLNEHPDKEFPLSVQSLVWMIDAVENGKLNYTAAAKKLFPELLKAPEKDPEQLCEALGLFDVQSDDELILMARDIIRIYPLKVEEYHKGKKGILSMFMGELMKRTAGKVDPKRATEILSNLLNEKH